MRKVENPFVVSTMFQATGIAMVCSAFSSKMLPTSIDDFEQLEGVAKERVIYRKLDLKKNVPEILNLDAFNYGFEKNMPEILNLDAFNYGFEKKMTETFNLDAFNSDFEEKMAEIISFDVIKSILEKSETETVKPNVSSTVERTQNLNMLDNIQAFTKDWNGYDAEPIPVEVIELCRNIVKELDVQPEIFPTARCTVQMEYELDDSSYLEFEVYQDRIHIMEIPKGNYSEAVNQEILSNGYQQLVQIVNRFHGGIGE